MSIASARQFCGDLFDSGNANARTKIRTYANGLIYVPGYLDETAQRALLADVEATLIEAPLFQPMMPKTGKAFSVEMSNCGPLGWVSDRDGGYRYQAMHPVTGKPWPAIPPLALNAWRELANYPALPDACLINYYDADARMGMHQDSDEKDLRAPVLSLYLAAPASSALAARCAAARRKRSNLNLAMRCSSPAMQGFAITASRAFCAAHRSSSKTTAASISPCGGSMSNLLRWFQGIPAQLETQKASYLRATVL